jgi:hypothetical protein
VPIVLADTFNVFALCICISLSSEEEKVHQSFHNHTVYHLFFDKNKICGGLYGGYKLHVSMPTPARVLLLEEALLIRAYCNGKFRAFLFWRLLVWWSLLEIRGLDGFL